MLGAIVYILQAEEDGWLPEFTGRIMHGAMFQILKEIAEALSMAYLVPQEGQKRL